MNWDEASEKLLRELWDGQGLSASQIAAQIGMTRAGVCGKVRRLGLSSRAVPAVTAARPKRRGAKNNHGGLAFKVASGTLGRPKPAKPLPPPRPPPPEAPVSLDLSVMELNDRVCKWPVSGVGARTLFCGCEKPIENGPYCPFHTERSEDKGTPGRRRPTRSSGAIG